MSATLINIQHGETGRLKEWPVAKPIPHGWARVSEPFEAAMTPPQPSEEARPRDNSFPDLPIRLKCKAGQVITIEAETLRVDPSSEVEALKARVVELEGALREAIEIVGVIRPRTAKADSQVIEELATVLLKARQALANTKEA